MGWLSDHRVDMINDILVENGVSYDELRNDLLDHVCCLVEEQMDDGRSFQQGLDTALDRFGLNQLKIIQETTLYLINSKLNTMKKTIGIIGLITSLLVILGVLFKILHFPGANIMLVLGITGSALVVFPLLGYLAISSTGSSSETWINLIGYAAGLVISLGVLFKIMHWPFASILLWSGVGLVALVFMPIYTVQAYRLAENKLFALSKSMLIIAGIVVVWGLSNLRVNAHHHADQPTSTTQEMTH
ncbi:hypothetical protein KFE98_03060 [bacterium SCSIO 12741]|nr:hypothetical protein KFE98_03060 [bacterium SCSIO 12741]